MRLNQFIAILFLIILFFACRKSEVNNSTQLFRILNPEETGIDFSNDLPIELELNILNYMYYYNGGGLASGDLNNDGLIDLVFSSNLGKEKIYLNEGNLKFRDISASTGVDGGDHGWTTGVSLVDINSDGFLDIYLCQVGNYRNLDNENKFFICTGIDDNGVPSYQEKAKELGLNFKGFSTHAGFLDYDLDGDLDMFLLNHSLHHNGTFGKRQTFLTTQDSFSGDRLFRNDNLRFVDVTQESGIYSHVSGYGLGVAFGDINLDGWPDIYVGNDFHENDYLYINQKNGTFKEELEHQIMHTSRFSMGVDIADINNDFLPDIISLDMLPEDPVILKRSEGEDALDLFRFKLNYGYNYQFAENNLQLNTGNNSFKEIAMYSKINATDWSWSPLIFDMDMDGKKDIFVSNGIPKRMNDIDYINFIAANDIGYKIQFDNLEEKELEIINQIPEIKIYNKFFLADAPLTYRDANSFISNNKISYSNSAIYADLDNDGDYDLVSNNIDDKAFVYENLSQKKASISINLNGPEQNKAAIGTKIISYSKSVQQFFENYASRGFQSTMINNILIGTDGEKIDSIVIIWPDNTYQSIINPTDSSYTLNYNSDLPFFEFGRLKNHSPYIIKDLTSDLGLHYYHKENDFVEFNREPLIPHCSSSEGPALAVGDINNDGLEDIYIGSSKREKPAIFIQNEFSKFELQSLLPEGKDSIYEEIDALITDLNNDKINDLIIASGGNEYRINSEYNRPLLYLNGKEGFSKATSPFDSIHMTASCVLPVDINEDGFTDIFFGGRALPWNYGKSPSSYMLVNRQNGSFAKAENNINEILRDIGFVKNGVWNDIDKDGDQDLILAMEWSEIIILINDGEQFRKLKVSNKKGWWNFVLPYDFDNDGDIDLLAGNLGLNSRLKASRNEPVQMYYADFDGNGTHEQVLSYYVSGKQIPFSNLHELQKQIPSIKKKYLFASDFAKASFTDIFGKDKLNSATILEANHFANTLFINEGNFNFKATELPSMTQLSSYYNAELFDFNSDGKMDVFLTGNYYDCNIQMGRYDADYGSILINTGNGSFEYLDPDGVEIKNQVRKMKKIKLADGSEVLLLAKNNDAFQAITILKNGE